MMLLLSLECSGSRSSVVVQTVELIGASEVAFVVLVILVVIVTVVAMEVHIVDVMDIACSSA